MRFYIAILIWIAVCYTSSAQTDQEKQEAYNIAIQAISLIDNGEIDSSILLLEKSATLDPNNINYPYEIGFAFYQKEDYSKSIESFEGIVKMKSASDQCYQMHGNAYDMNGQPDEAIKAYQSGLEHFPNSGKLYFELANMHQDDWMVNQGINESSITLPTGKRFKPLKKKNVIS